MFQSSLFKFNREYYASNKTNRIKSEEYQDESMGMPIIEYSIPVVMQQPQGVENRMDDGSSFWSSTKFGLSNNAYSHLNKTITTTQYTSSNSLESPLSTQSSSTIPVQMLQEQVESSLPKQYSIHIEFDDHHSENDQHIDPFQSQQHMQAKSNEKFVSQEEFFQQVYQRFQTNDDSNSNTTPNNNTDGQELATNILSSFSFWG